MTCQDSFETAVAKMGGSDEINVVTTRDDYLFLNQRTTSYRFSSHIHFWSLYWIHILLPPDLFKWEAGTAINDSDVN